LLILDEIFTGFGRTGAWFACEHTGVVPDVICLGKALAGGFPLAACVGRADLMDEAWPSSTGEAIHTSTFLGHPVGCAMALAQIAEIQRLGLVGQSARAGALLLRELRSRLGAGKERVQVRGAGLMVGVELRRADGSPATAETLTVTQRMLQRGFIVLPEGEYSNVISLAPPLIVTESQLRTAARALGQELEGILASAQQTSARRRRFRS
jgi:4-aminobutyrate aminotransferase-like enzyme